MKVVIKDDPSIVVAAQQFMQSDKEAAGAFKQTARNHHVELMVNTVIDRKPQRPPVAHHNRSPEHRQLALNVKTPVKREARQSWAIGATFPNAHAFPDNPLRTAQDYLFR
jgi:hypothetical protein